MASLRPRSWARAGKVESKDIGVADFNVRRCGELGLERGSKGRIELDQRQMPGSAGEQTSDRAAAGADLQHGIIGNVSERRDDFAAGICIY